MKDVIVGVILFNPNKQDLILKIESILKQFEKIILFDNSTNDNSPIASFCSGKSNIIYKTENRNCGMAYALNRIMDIAKEFGYSWVLTFDQDSEIPTNILNEYQKYFDEQKVGIICSQVIDRRRKYMKLNDGGEAFDKVNKCITSASCTNIEAWEKAGKYDELLFIDLVDNDFSKRVRYAGFEIYRVNSVVLEQQYGKIEYKNTLLAKIALWLGKKLNNNNIAKLSYKKYISPMRIYYTNRNVLYLNRKHKLYGGIGYESYYCKNFVEFYILFNLASIFRSEDKVKVLKMVIEGTVDGIKLRRNAIPYRFTPEVRK